MNVMASDSRFQLVALFICSWLKIVYIIRGDLSSVITESLDSVIQSSITKDASTNHLMDI